MTRILSLLFAPIVASCVGCVGYGAATAPDEPHFEHLREGRIAAFDQRIKADLQSGAVSDETRVGLAWLDFLRCEQIGAYELRGPQARWAVELLRAEEARRATYVLSRRSEPSKMRDLPYGAMAADQPLTWAPLELAAEGAIVWPAEDEDWADELTAASEVESACPDLLNRLLGLEDDPDEEEKLAAARKTGMELVWPHYVRQFKALEAADQAFDEADGMSAEAAAVDLRARIYAYLVVERFRTIASERDDFVMPESFVDNVRDALTRRVAKTRERFAARPALLDETLSTASYLLAVDAFQREELDDARARLAEARSGEPPERLYWPIRHLELWITWEAGRWEAIVADDDTLPPPNNPDFGSYVYRKSTGLLRANKPDRFLAIVMEAMADRSWSNDPFLEATWGKVLRYLSDVPFDERVVELVENLGPRSGIYERMEELGRTALDVGRPAVADDVATWLLARDSDARRHPRYFALRAMADFLRDDRQGFTQEIRKITRRDPKLLEALPASRQARFFEPADRELARIMSQTMPLMAEWGDDSASIESRRQWLTLMVEEIQRFLRTAQETSARSQLVELYRLASRLLDEHPRGYAERVGRPEGQSLVLGTVRVDPAELEGRAFLATSLISVTNFLAPIPRDAPISAWNSSWPLLKLGGAR